MWESLLEEIADSKISFFINLLSAIFSFIMVTLFLWRPRIVISDRIARGVNRSVYDDGEVAWKFKIVNKSMLMAFYNFDIKLTGIRYETLADNTRTQHIKTIETVAAVRRLTRYIPRPILWIKRKVNPNYTISFAYRPLTYCNLDELASEYSEFKLSVLCTDSLTGKTHYAEKVFEFSPVYEGEFTNDGRTNVILSKRIPAVAWENHENRMRKEISKKQNDDKEKK